MCKDYLVSPVRLLHYFFMLSFVVFTFGQINRSTELGKGAHGTMYVKGKASYAGVKSVSHFTNLPHQDQKIRKSAPRVILPGVRRLVPQEYPTIQVAIDSCVDGDTVLISEGTYYENIRYKGKAIVVASLYLIDGDTTHISQTTIDGSNPSHPDSGSVVYFIDGEDTSSVLCGLTITNGTGTRGFWDGIWYRNGGGVYCDWSGARIINNYITHNRVVDQFTNGAGLAAENSGEIIPYLILEENRISDNYNRADSTGLDGFSGGADIWGTSARVVGNLFERDTAVATQSAFGGGMCIGGSSPTGPFPDYYIQANIFRKNFVYSQSLYSDGGGLRVDYSFATIIGNYFIGNESGLNGGGLYIGDGSNVTIINNYFYNNATSLNPIPPVLGAGGAIFGASPLLMENNILSGNSAQYGGGVALGSSGTLCAINNTIIGNSAMNDGGGMIFWEGIHVLLLNNILWNNSGGGQISHQSSFPGHYYYNNIQGGWLGEGNIDIQPQFADTLFHLLPSSYCIGMGRSAIKLGDSTYNAPLFDLEGNARPNPIDTLVDIGAYETAFPARVHIVMSIINQGRGYLHPCQDSVRILVQMLDPHQQSVGLTANMSNLPGAVWDEFPLFDDGQHGDSLAGDNLFGAILPPVMLEDAFRFNYLLANNTFQDTMSFQGEQQITSIGPLVFEDYHILSQNSNRIQLELVLRNLGQYSTASEVRAELIPLDSAVIRVFSNNRSFGDIPAGGTAVNSSAYIIDTIENPGTISFAVRISMGGYPYWRQEGLVVGIEQASQQLPGEFVLYQNYPNPFNANTNIEFRKRNSLL